MGARRYPEPPLPEAAPGKPGIEAELEPRPEYEAPDYRGSGKLEGKVALITGGDSASAARWRCCSPARARTSRSST